jgi:nicotinamidase-related amidase
VATDYCIRAVALGLLARSRQVLLVSDAIRAVAADTEAKACRELSAAGVIWTSTEHVVDMLGHSKE